MAKTSNINVRMEPAIKNKLRSSSEVLEYQ